MKFPLKIYFDKGGNQFLDALRHALPATSKSWFSFYNSTIDAIVTQPHLMISPIDDHMSHRGHAVFDTCNVAAGQAYGLGMHLDRLQLSAKRARIEPSFTQQEMKDIILHTLAATGRRDGIFCRYWLSAGRGDFAVTPKQCVGGSSFYVMVHAWSNKDFLSGGTEEWVVSVPAKPSLLATMKSNNYMINALTAMESEDKGGMLGLQVDAQGRLLESAIANVAIVDQDGWLRTPCFDEILSGTTVARALDLAQPLVEKGVLQGTAVGDIQLEEASSSKEMLGFGGGGVWPIRKLNGQAIGSGQPGPVYNKLRELLLQDFHNPKYLDKIPYELYET
mmetsp:Transcript_38878/g.51233  ORF Transcript_38878/g.51233 Transcript_38878/m.51233 type:complete len:334 (+) Transcript_38878:93-1094(+)